MNKGSHPGGKVMFFWTLFKRGGGVNPCSKILSEIVVRSGGHLTTWNLHEKGLLRHGWWNLAIENENTKSKTMILRAYLLFMIFFLNRITATEFSSGFSYRFSDHHSAWITHTDISFSEPNILLLITWNAIMKYEKKGKAQKLSEKAV